MSKPKYAKASKKNLLPIIAVAAILLVILISVVIMTAVHSGSETILKGVSAGGVDLSGKTAEEAELIISERINSVKDEEIEIIVDGTSFNATYSDFGASYNCKLTAEEAFNYGHGGFFSSIVPAIKATFGVKTNLDLSVYINNRVFDETMSELSDYDSSVQASYVFKEGAIEVTNGKSAYTINPVSAKQVITDAMTNLDFSTITFIKEHIEPISLDIDLISEKYSKEATSATYYRDADGSIKVTDGNDQVIVDKKLATEIIESHTTPGETYEIPATIVFAEYTREELEDALFRDVMGSYTTSYSSSNANRSHNVGLAAASCNDKILLPGESFSYNTALGRRTPEAGYKLAGAYLNGQTVQEYGGGICQVSSTLYNAVLRANLKIDERLCHMFPVAYVPLGLDATVDYGTVDFVFSNDTDFPIKVVSYTTSSKQVVCEIIGTKTENFTVSFETTGISSISYTTETIEDPTLPLGEEVIEEKGSNGTKCSVYRVVSVDGVVKSRTFESSSYYMAHKEVKRVGTGEAVSDVPSEEQIAEQPAETVPVTPSVTVPEQATPEVTVPEQSVPEQAAPSATVPEASPAVSEL